MGVVDDELVKRPFLTVLITFFILSLFLSSFYHLFFYMSQRLMLRPYRSDENIKDGMVSY